jgi:hypothetical protein
MLSADGYFFEANRSLIFRIPKRKTAGRGNPSERFLSNTGGANVSIRTLGSHLSNRRNPRPRGQKIFQATGIGNSITIIDAEAALVETAFRWSRTVKLSA